MSPQVRARELLAQPGAWLDRLGEAWLVRPGPDRRRRPLLRLDARAAQALQRDPGLLPRGGGGWVLAGRDEGAAPGRLLEHVTRAGPDGRQATMTINRGESPIAWLARRKGPDGRPFLEPLEVAAAERLRDDVELAGMGGRVTMDWSAPPRDRTARGPGHLPPAGAARRRVRQALTEVGPGLSEVLVEVCLYGSALQAAERSLGLPSRTGKVRLKLALERLARHYRMV
jgi:hypothetical protein